MGFGCSQGSRCCLDGAGLCLHRALFPFTQLQSGRKRVSCLLSQPGFLDSKAPSLLSPCFPLGMAPALLLQAIPPEHMEQSFLSLNPLALHDATWGFPTFTPQIKHHSLPLFLLLYKLWLSHPPPSFQLLLRAGLRVP